MKQHDFDTPWFTFYNANPKNKRTCDCVIRALSVALDISWKDTLKELTEMSCETGFMVNEKSCYDRVLSKHGFVMQKQPLKQDGTRLTAIEFVNLIPDETAVVKILNHHLTVVKNGMIFDTWNCSRKRVGNYWIIPNSK